MFSKLFNDQRPLMIAGIIFFVGALIMAILTTFDTTQILGINRWVKPLKFYFSVGVFLWTIAVYLAHLPHRAGFLHLFPG